MSFSDVLSPAALLHLTFRMIGSEEGKQGEETQSDGAAKRDLSWIFSAKFSKYSGNVSII